MTDSLLASLSGRSQVFFQNHQKELQHISASGQSPEVLFISCADSRVTPEALFGLAPGEWFIVRNVANIVPPYWQTELSLGAALEFAVLDLKIKHIVVCGHTDCGGMQALHNPPDLSKRPGLARWVDISRPLLASSAADQNVVSRLRTLTERNVVLQLDNLRSYPYVRAAEQTSWLTLHGWLYDLALPGIFYYDADTDSFHQ